jgi:hypothetical protein
MSLLTIKHVEKSGYESIQQAHSVSFTPAKLAHPDKVDPKDELIAFGCTGKGGAVDSDGVCRYGDGTVYVMNDAGSTVGKYHLN